MKDSDTTTTYRNYKPNPIKDLRAEAPPSNVKTYKAIPDGNGDFLRDKTGNLILGEEVGHATGD